MGLETRVIVAGGGIGGLATAIGLRTLGMQVEVMEKASAIGETGSGISLWGNGLRALDALGIGSAVRARALPQEQAQSLSRSGHHLSRLSSADAGETNRRHGPILILPRAELYSVLLGALPESALRLGVRVDHVETDTDGVRITHSAGRSDADLLVGADGLRSLVRTRLWPDAPGPRYAGYTAWRMITEPLPQPPGLCEIWGRGQRFGIAPMTGDRVYAFAAATAPTGWYGGEPEYDRLRRTFGDWPGSVRSVLDAVEPETLLRHDIYDLPPLPSFIYRRVVLLGDAAHAMTPDLGQGAGQALEDAATLTALLGSHPIDAAIAEYDRLRVPRTHMIAARARAIGRVAQATSRPVTYLRDTAMRLTPRAVSSRGLDSILTWTPPHEATHHSQPR